MSQASSSGNTAELLLHFCDQQAKHNENHVEVGAISGACFVYHPKGCNRCATYVEHLLADIDQHPAKFSFPRDEILDQIHEAWPHVSGYITKTSDECDTLEKEIFQERSDNCCLCDEVDDLQERIQELETQLASLQTTSPQVLKHGLTRRPDYWSLHMWNTLKDWHTNPMSVPNAIRDNSEGYFLEEDVDVVAWISKVSSDISRPTFMNQMKVSHLSVHAPTPAKTGESSQQHLDADLDSYHQAQEPVLSYDEVPPSGTPDVEMEVPATAGTSGTLPSESTMNVDQELDDLYQ
ncbi:hypothetical protein M422DRAFT_239500 [Sphaerobolus stellatus SS14]|nr:hypothetical protein M422DRAFT_239500 [Sphaerobolus stellatus SS14]